MLGTDFLPTRMDTYPAISPLKVDLKGKSVLITGASRGCGVAIAASYAAAGSTNIAIGARTSTEATAVAIRSAARSVGRPEPTILELKLDITDLESIKKAANSIRNAFGGLDILVNNAGIMSPWAPIGNSDISAWWREWEVNVKGTYMVTRQLLELILASSLKTVVNIVSCAAFMYFPGASGYHLTKMALVRFTEHLSKDHAADGLLTYAVHPGCVKTDMAAMLPNEIAASLVYNSAEMTGDSLVWLSKERRKWLAGRYIDITWDMEELDQQRKRIEDEELLKVRLAVNTFP